jgi:hypothetical protein
MVVSVGGKAREQTRAGEHPRSREVHVRFCERLGVQLLGPTLPGFELFELPAFWFVDVRLVRVDGYMTNPYVISLHCPDPECCSLGAQRCTFDRLQLEASLKKGEEIKAIGGKCNHSWSLTDGMKDKL